MKTRRYFGRVTSSLPLASPTTLTTPLIICSSVILNSSPTHRCPIRYGSTKPSQSDTKQAQDQRYNGSPHPNYEVWVGLETHAQITSNSKLFSGASTSFLAQPNSHTAFFDAALPGTLPRINEACVEQAVKTGLALGGKINLTSKFDRKHYFYCDMPLGYQITQHKKPVVEGGALNVPMYTHGAEKKSKAKKGGGKNGKGEITTKQSETEKKVSGEGERVVDGDMVVRLQRIQIEQDSGKNLHDVKADWSHVDLNRAGCALMEIVTEPDIRSADEAARYLRKLQTLLRHVGSSTANMEDGSLRCDVNVTVRRIEPKGKMTQRVEIKNLNSIRAITRSILYEAKRQIEMVERGEEVERETRSFDAKRGVTERLRSKEELLDYRFLPEPDLPTLRLSKEYVAKIKENLPELPDAMLKRLTEEHEIALDDAHTMVNAPDLAKYFMELIKPNQQQQQQQQQGEQGSRPPKVCTAWLLTELLGRLNRKRQAQAGPSAIINSTGGNLSGLNQPGEDDSNNTSSLITSSTVQPDRLGELIDLVVSGTISGKQGKQVLDMMVMDGDERRPTEICEAEGMALDSDPVRIEQLCQTIVALYPQEVVNLLRDKKEQFAGFLVGQVIKLSKIQHENKEFQGEVNPKIAAKIMQSTLKKVDWTKFIEKSNDSDNNS